MSFRTVFPHKTGIFRIYRGDNRSREIVSACDHAFFF